MDIGQLAKVSGEKVKRTNALALAEGNISCALAMKLAGVVGEGISIVRGYLMASRSSCDRICVHDVQ